ncbi:MAG: hypothetical protein FWG22_03705 [Prolixibacteraceae bacterium]|nr:hypothetical protein [Prolixibacteraceae bacterium]
MGKILNQKKMKKYITIIILFAAFVLLYACSMEKNDVAYDSAGEGSGGSMARFTIVGDYLYTVDHWTLNSFDISNPAQPNYKSKISLGFGVETISPFNGNLFIGTTHGMYIFDTKNPANPTELSFFSHAYACDPVVSDGKYAYITLSSNNTTCRRFVNELQIIDIQDIQRPELVKEFALEGPRGLTVRNDTLWICDNGLKVFDIKDKQNIEQIFHFPEVSAYDLILNKNLALVIGETGFVQYKLENDEIRKLSEIK